MPVTGYVGLPGQGKTLELVRQAVLAHKEGRDVWSNFLFGGRFQGYQTDCCILDFTRSRVDPAHEHDLVLEPETPASRQLAEVKGWRSGRGFVPASWSFFVDSWDTLMELRVQRDVFGKPHKLACRMEACDGCSKGLSIFIDELNLWAPSRMWADLGIGVLTRWAYVRKDGMNVYWSAQHEARIDKVAREVTDFIFTCRRSGPFGPIPAFFFRAKWEPRVLESSGTDRNGVGSSEGKVRAMRFEWNFLKKSVAECYDTYERVKASKHLTEAAEKKAAAAAKAATRPLRVVNGGRS